MKIRKDETFHGTVWIYATVDGARDMKVPYTSQTMAPFRLQVTYQLTKEGTYRPSGWTVYGGRRLKSGAVSDKATHEASGSFYDREGVMPWILEAADLWNPGPLTMTSAVQLELAEEVAYR